MPYYKVKEDTEEEIKSVIRRKSGIGFNMLLEEVSVTKPTLYKRLKELKENNEIEKTKEPKDSFEKSEYVDNSRTHYYLTEKEIKKDKHQASLCRGLIFDLVEETVDPKTLFEDFKEKQIYEVENLLMQNILRDDLHEWTQKKYKNLRLHLKECTEESHITHLKNVLSAYMLKESVNKKIEEIVEKDDDEIKEEVRKFYLATGPLLNQKKVYSIKIILKHLTDKFFSGNNQDNIGLLSELKKQIIDPTYPPPCYDTKPKQITETEKEKLIEGVDNILAMSWEERYDKYLHLDIANAVILDGERQYPTVIPWEGNDFYREITSGLPTPDSIIQDLLQEFKKK